MSNYDKKFLTLILTMASIPTFGPVICHIVKFW
jgi:hypothetical protein